MLLIVLLAAAQIDGLRLPELDGWTLHDDPAEFGAAPSGAAAVYRRGGAWMAVGRRSRSAAFRALSAEDHRAWAAELEAADGVAWEAVDSRAASVLERRAFVSLHAAGGRRVGLAQVEFSDAIAWIRAEGPDIDAPFARLLDGLRERRPGRTESLVRKGPFGIAILIVGAFVAIWRRRRWRDLFSSVRRDY